jgi:nicotinic acid phosphoribosyltransferase
VKKILEAVLKEGFSAQNVAFGMGGGLLQKVNRDTMSFATKLSFIEYANGEQRDVMKLPKTDAGKTSLPGVLRVKRDPNTGLEIVLPRGMISITTTTLHFSHWFTHSISDHKDRSYEQDDLLRPVYDNGPIPNVWEDFNTIRNRVQVTINRASSAL